MSDKFERNILARGLTASNVGSVIVVDEQSFKVLAVAYGPNDTLVQVENWLSIPNAKEITIID